MYTYLEGVWESSVTDDVEKVSVLGVWLMQRFEKSLWAPPQNVVKPQVHGKHQIFAFRAVRREGAGATKGMDFNVCILI